MDTCPVCGDDYKRLGSHWAVGSCDRPEVDEYKMSLLRGMLLGDACVNSYSEGYDYIAINMTNKPFLEWLSDELSWLATDVRLKKTAEEQYNHTVKHNKSSNLENFNNIYTLQTRSHPEISEFTAWYSSGEKRFPSDMDLNLLELKLWYVCDGNVGWYIDSSNPRVEIACSNEHHRKDYLVDLVSNLGYEVYVSNEKLVFTVDSSREFISDVEQVPGFQYKFEIQDRSRYEELK